MSLSACVTRILSLSGFESSLKTRDIQAAFSDFGGSFKIKWIDDTSLLIVFDDAMVAKKAYLSTLVNPPPLFTSPTGDKTVSLRPYDGPDAQNVIAAVNSRANGGHRARPSMSASSGNVMAGLVQVGGAASGVAPPTLPPSLSSTAGHARSGSRQWKKPLNVDPNYPPQISSTSPLAREPSPSLPNLPSQPTLGSLISSSLTGISTHDGIVTS